jgi:hypothetical protein
MLINRRTTERAADELEDVIREYRNNPGGHQHIAYWAEASIQEAADRLKELAKTMPWIPEPGDQVTTPSHFLRYKPQQGIVVQGSATVLHKPAEDHVHVMWEDTDGYIEEEDINDLRPFEDT